MQITEKDEEVLEHLIDIRVEELGGAPAAKEGEEEEEEECGFRLVFTFQPNEFFSETVLVRAPGRPRPEGTPWPTRRVWQLGRCCRRCCSGARAPASVGASFAVSGCSELAALAVVSLQVEALGKQLCLSGCSQQPEKGPELRCWSLLVELIIV